MYNTHTMLSDSSSLYLKLMESLFKGKQALIPTFEKYDLTSLQAFLLLLLSSDKGTSMSSLAQYLHCDASNITILTEKLASAKLIKRAEDPDDRRYKLIFLSKKGGLLKKRILSEIKEIQEASLKSNKISPKQLDEAIDTINKFFS